LSLNFTQLAQNFFNTIKIEISLRGCSRAGIIERQMATSCNISYGHLAIGSTKLEKTGILKYLLKLLDPLTPRRFGIYNVK